MISKRLLDIINPVGSLDMSYDPLDDMELSEEYEDWEDENFE